MHSANFGNVRQSRSPTCVARRGQAATVPRQRSLAAEHHFTLSTGHCVCYCRHVWNALGVCSALHPAGVWRGRVEARAGGRGLPLAGVLHAPGVPRPADPGAGGGVRAGAGQLGGVFHALLWPLLRALLQQLRVRLADPRGRPLLLRLPAERGRPAPADALHVPAHEVAVHVPGGRGRRRRRARLPQRAPGLHAVLHGAAVADRGGLLRLPAGADPLGGDHHGGREPAAGRPPRAGASSPELRQRRVRARTRRGRPRRAQPGAAGGARARAARALPVRRGAGPRRRLARRPSRAGRRRQAARRLARPRGPARARALPPASPQGRALHLRRPASAARGHVRAGAAARAGARRGRRLRRRRRQQRRCCQRRRGRRGGRRGRGRRWGRGGGRRGGRGAGRPAPAP